jgi:malonyl CoA-acyl carrier protein transacylase
MFPGQGSQAQGMGGALFDEFKELTRQADATLGYSIKELCLEDPRKELNRTQYTQPALYVVNALSYYKKIKESGAKPDFLAGHSLGELNALLAAECFDFETGLKLVRNRGELMSRVAGGAMAAILNATREEIQTILANNGLDDIDLANCNTPSQIVISGPADQIGRAQPLFEQGNMLFHPLNTSGAFHSRFMAGVQEEFRRLLATMSLSTPKIPVIANVTAQPYRSDAIQDTLARQIASTVQWSPSIQYLMAVGIERGETMHFEEVGHGDVLTRMLQTIRRQSPADVLERLSRDINAQREVVSTVAENVGSQALERPATAADKVAVWNRSYPIGTRVKSLSTAHADLQTRTQAVVLFGHRAAIYMKGYNGYFDLDEIVPV